MKITTTADRLKAALDATAALSPGTGKRPQLEATLITVKDPGVAEFAATDGNDSFWFCLDKLDAWEAGVVFIPSANLLEAVKKAKKEAITIAWDGKGGRASIAFEKTTVTLPIEEVGDAPAITRFDAASPSIKLPMRDLVAMFDRTNFAVMGDFKGKRVLSGVCVTVKPKTLRCVATDAVRIATVERDIENPAGAKGSSIVVPIQTKLLKPLVNEDTDTIDVQPTEGTLRFRGPRGELTRRAMVGTYPDYDIEKNLVYTTKVEVPTKPFTELLGRAMILKDTGPRSCKLMWTANGLNLELTSNLDGSVGSSLDVPWPHPPLTLLVDPTLLAQAVKAVDAEKLTLSFGKPDQPTILREEGSGFLFLYALSPKF